MRGLHIGKVDRIHSLFASVLFLAVLFLWQQSYAGSCATLVFPVLVWLAIFNGLLQSRLERKRFTVDYYLDRRSFVHRRLRAAVRADQPDRGWTARGVSGCLRRALAPSRSSSAPQPRQHPCSSTVCRIRSGAISGVTPETAGAGQHLPPPCPYGRPAWSVWPSSTSTYYLIPVPTGIDPASLERTVEAFSARSACPLVEDVPRRRRRACPGTSSRRLRLQAARGRIAPVGCFLSRTPRCGGVIRGLEGSILLACATVVRHRQE